MSERLQEDELRRKLRELPVLRTERLTLRKITREDRDSIFEYASRPEVTRFTYFSYHRSLQETDTWIDQVLKDYESGEQAAWAIVPHDVARMIGAIGMVNISVRDARLEIGYAIHPDHWGKGITAEAVRAVIDFAFHDLGMLRVEAKCAAEHAASARVMEKAGMNFEGVLRRHTFLQGAQRDMKLYAAIRSRS